MKEINNKLILTLAILAFVFGLFLASPVHADGTVYSGLVFTPYAPVYNSPNPNNYYNSSNNTPEVIPGCDGRTTGFSSTTGQSCFGNLVNNNSNSTTTTKNTDTNTTVSNNTNATTTNNTGNNTNPTYGSLGANALVGSNNGFMPSGLLQWIIFILLVLALVFLWRYVHGSKEKYMLEPMKHA
jgi:ATP-dependent Zn protease